jgi:hypothetical protein
MGSQVRLGGYDLPGMLAGPLGGGRRQIKFLVAFGQVNSGPPASGLLLVAHYFPLPPVSLQDCRSDDRPLSSGDFGQILVHGRRSPRSAVVTCRSALTVSLPRRSLVARLSTV